MRALALLVICMMTWAGRVEAQEPRTQVRVADLQVRATATMDSVTHDLSQLDTSHARVLESAEAVAALYAELSAGIEEVARLAERLSMESTDRATTTRLQDQLLQTIGGLQQMQIEAHMQFLALQNQMQQESRQYQTISNALKARHDAAMSAIRNMK